MINYDIPTEKDNIVRAVCINSYDRWAGKDIEELQIGKQYIVEYAVINSSSTSILLKGTDGTMFSSTHFHFYMNGERINLIEEARPFIGLFSKDYKGINRIIKYKSATKEGWDNLKEIYYDVPVIDSSWRRITICLKDIYYDTRGIDLPQEIDVYIYPLVEDVKEYAIDGWILGDTHGLSHWQRVERNGIILSLEVGKDGLCFNKDINMRVVRLFAYLHDKCRMDDGADLEHGERAADMLLYSLRNTLLKILTDEEFTMLKKACRLHTTTHKTGNPTIDVCFDADRLDLGRVGIVPQPNRMATKQGEYYAMYPHKFERIAELMTIRGHKKSQPTQL